VAIVVANPAAGQGLEEVIVTAQKRAQNLQEVPVSISAFSGEQIAELGVFQAKDIATQSPGVFTKNTAGDVQPIFYIRGIGLNDFFSNNNPTASVYVDQVIQPFGPMLNFAVFDVERVEVLKGPQGTLYGRNNTGGAINFISRKPSAERDGYARFDYGRWDTWEFEGALGGALMDNLDGRVSFYTRQSDGFQENPTLGEDVAETNRLGGRLQIAWQATEDLSVLLNIHGGREDGQVQFAKLANSQDPANTFAFCPAALEGRVAYDGSCTDLLGFFDPNPDPHTVLGDNSGHDFDNSNENHGFGTAITIDWDVGRMTLTSVTGYDRFLRHEGIDFDGSPVVSVDNVFEDSMWAISQEVRLTSDESWPIDWIAGVFYSVDENDGLQRIRSDAFLGFIAGLPPPASLFQPFLQHSESVALFGQFEWPFMERWKFIGGLRLTHEDKEFRGSTSFDSGPIGRIPVTFNDDEVDFDDISGKVGVNFTPMDDWLLYASFSKGFKSGGFNAAFASDPIQREPFEPEALWSVEAGSKATLFDGSMVFNAAFYYYLWKDFQASIITTGSLGIPIQILTNAGDAEVYGIEWDALWQPVEGFDIQLAMNLMDHEITKGQLEDDRLANAPKLQFAGNVHYVHPLPWNNLDFIVQGDFSYRSSFDFKLNPTPLGSDDGYWLGNARVGIGTRDERIQVFGWVRNIGDKDYLVEVFEDLPINVMQIWGAPRSYGVSLQYNFF
jgi:iron complex outermembrane receptor protein